MLRWPPRSMRSYRLFPSTTPFRSGGLPAHVLPTRADNLGRGAAGNTLQAVRRELSNAFGDTVSVQTFSGESKQGVDEAREVVGRWLGFQGQVQALRQT